LHLFRLLDYKREAMEGARGITEKGGRFFKMLATVGRESVIQKKSKIFLSINLL